MKTLFGAMIVDGRNKINGFVASKNRYGSYMRTKTTPVNPQTTAQQAVRARLSAISSLWRQLTESQRQGWIDAAANFPFTDIFGNTKTLSGQALFVKLNTNASSVGANLIEDAPAPVAVPSVSLLTIAATDTPSVSVVFTPTPVAADFVLVIETTGNVTPGKSFVKNLFCRVTQVDAAGTSPANILTAFQAVHGNPVADQKIFVRAFFISSVTGQAGIALQAVTIVTT
jgi:hypothetical protein